MSDTKRVMSNVTKEEDSGKKSEKEANNNVYCLEFSKLGSQWMEEIKKKDREAEFCSGIESKIKDQYAEINQKLSEFFDRERKSNKELLDDMSAKLEDQKADFTKQLLEERFKVSELRERQRVFEDSEGELRKQWAEACASKLKHKCPGNVSEEEEKCECEVLEEEKANLTYYLNYERNQVLLHAQHNTLLEKEKAGLQSEKENMWKMLLQLQEDKANLDQEIGAERQRQRDLSRELEDKKAALEEEKRSLKQLKIADEDLKNKVLELENRCLKLVEENKVWAAEKEFLLMSLNSQVSVVEAYKEIRNKEECLFKLFQNR